MAIALGFTALMALMAIVLLSVAPRDLPDQTNLARGSLPLQSGTLLDIARAGLAAAEAQLTGAPAWEAGLSPQAFGGGTYSVTVQPPFQEFPGTYQVRNSLELRSTATDAQGRRRVLARRLGLGSDAFQYAIYSGGSVSLSGLSTASSVRGGIYGRTGVATGGTDDGYYAVTASSGGPDIAPPTVDYRRYERFIGFDEAYSTSKTLSGDHLNAEIVFVRGNCILDASDRGSNSNPFSFGTLIVTGNITLEGPATASPVLTSVIAPAALDNEKSLPAILCYGNLRTGTGASVQPAGPLSIDGLVWVEGSVDLENLHLRGTLIAGGNVSLRGNCTIEPESLLQDPMTYPPYFEPGIPGLFLTRVSEYLVE